MPSFFNSSYTTTITNSYPNYGAYGGYYNNSPRARMINRGYGYGTGSMTFTAENKVGGAQTLGQMVGVYLQNKETFNDLGSAIGKGATWLWNAGKTAYNWISGLFSKKSS